MLVTTQHILAGVKETQLRALLVLHSLNIGVLDFLKVELRHFDGGFPNRQNAVNHLDGFQMSVYPMLNGGGKPALWLSSIKEPLLTVARFAVPSGPAILPARRQEFLDVSARRHFCLKEHG